MKDFVDHEFMKVFGIPRRDLFLIVGGQACTGFMLVDPVVLRMRQDFCRRPYDPYALGALRDLLFDQDEEAALKRLAVFTESWQNWVIELRRSSSRGRFRRWLRGFEKFLDEFLPVIPF